MYFGYYNSAGQLICICQVLIYDVSFVCWAKTEIQNKTNEQPENSVDIHFFT